MPTRSRLALIACIVVFLWSFVSLCLNPSATRFKSLVESCLTVSDVSLIACYCHKNRRNWLHVTKIYFNVWLTETKLNNRIIDDRWTMFQYIWSIVYWYLRPLIKWFLHQTTQMCELQRICYGEPPGTSRTLAIERSLRLSQNEDIKALVSRLDALSDRREITRRTERQILEDAIRTILFCKKINPLAHPDFAKSFGRCVELIWGYRQLCIEVEEVRKTSYDAENAQHEILLLKLWNLLMPDEPLESRVTKQWQNIGFQGDDPKTDFRGMGVLGLENLVYFAQEYPNTAKHVLSHSTHPRYGYAFAIVGINLTSMALRLLRDGSAKTHIFNASKRLPSIQIFHQFYCYLFYEFDGLWIESKPSDMMEFSSIQQKFENSIRISLANPKTVVRMSVSVDNV